MNLGMPDLADTFSNRWLMAATIDESGKWTNRALTAL
ncbi:hypothetical protein FHS15_004212 [Paenibacillus castaneae]|nr:hypothetical protein [Paenibacillus castaneae]